MDFNKVETISKWKEALKHDYIVQNSETLLVILPGYAYESVAPLLYYAGSVGMEEGCDLLCIEYGYQKKQVDIDIFKELSTLVEETKKAIDKALKSNYKKIIFVGKSLGTFIMNELRKEYSEKNTSYIYLTPTDRSIPKNCCSNVLIVFGSGDNKLSKELVIEIKKRNDIEVIEIKDANHSLEFKSTIKSINELSVVVKRCKEFIHKYKY